MSHTPFNLLYTKNKTLLFFRFTSCVLFSNEMSHLSNCHKTHSLHSYIVSVFLTESKKTVLEIKVFQDIIYSKNAIRQRQSN